MIDQISTQFRPNFDVVRGEKINRIDFDLISTSKSGRSLADESGGRQSHRKSSFDLGRNSEIFRPDFIVELWSILNG